MTKKFPSQEMDRFNVRLPAGMRDAIAERADKHGRSMNSEIVQILHDKLTGPESLQIDIEFHELFRQITDNEAADYFDGFDLDDFKEKDKKIDILIDALIHRIKNDNEKIRELLMMKRGLTLKK
ncbi:Arc family DNA-binding protein [Proteus mirabilis]|uniref:Arc family DNA-binding protein n=1 Tax=Proteus TaxID=583 RepID=UPI00080A907B|nr:MULTISPECIES: Arc family DNA-binding protein [Proteus]MCL8533026.1 Arc family DNA-binding protein [Proteus mirabilis]MCT8247007.1 Arc family DNA-binding protein [Proteus mirabilis]MDF7162329.1 Arc family DNA-binding protein [Proteus mirabilis]MDF7225508.1 Arc family DNA-binding protein [Proteus mirabilis]MDF7281440.1 Arc family DNA-binding protein [Proteus mirabilis]